MHTYRGTLGSHIALLVRRLRAHLARARQEFLPDVPEAERSVRYPSLIPVGTSATIKSVSEAGLPREEVIRLRDEAVRSFFGKLTGAVPEAVRVLGEELEDIPTLAGAAYPPAPVDAGEFDVRDLEAVRQALCRLSGQPADTLLAIAAERTRLLWDLNRWLVSAPMSLGQIVALVRADVPERAGAPDAAVEREVTQALLAGAALPDGVPGALRLRSHRMVRGGWRFHRCVDPACGRLYPMGEDRCTCGRATAPLYLCRNCGADALRFAGDPDAEPLRPAGPGVDGADWMLYDRARIEGDPTEDDEDDDEENEEAPRRPRNGRGRAPRPDQMGGRPVRTGSFDAATLAFSGPTRTTRSPWSSRRAGPGASPAGPRGGAGTS